MASSTAFILRILMKYFLLASLFTFNALACNNHTKLKAGEAAPCDGRLLSDPAAQRVKDKYTVLEGTVENQKQRLSLKDLAIDDKSKEADLWKAEAQKQALEVQKHDKDLRNGVLMGVGGTILMLLLINKVK